MNFITRSEGETMAFAAKLAPMLAAGDTVLLEGDLGAGKSVLARGIARGRELGFLDALFSCAGEGLLPVAAAAAKANMSEDEFRARMERDRANGGQSACGE